MTMDYTTNGIILFFISPSYIANIILVFQAIWLLILIGNWKERKEEYKKFIQRSKDFDERVKKFDTLVELYGEQKKLEYALRKSFKEGYEDEKRKEEKALGKEEKIQILTFNLFKISNEPMTYDEARKRAEKTYEENPF